MISSSLQWTCFSVPTGPLTLSDDATFLGGNVKENEIGKKRMLAFDFNHWVLIETIEFDLIFEFFEKKERISNFFFFLFGGLFLKMAKMELE